MAKKMKFSDDISDYFQMTIQFERKSRKFATNSTVFNVEVMPFPENLIQLEFMFMKHYAPTRYEPKIELKLL